MKPYITSYTQDQVWFSGRVWAVYSNKGEIYQPSAVFQVPGKSIAVLRCRLWGLLHGYGWLKEKK